MTECLTAALALGCGSFALVIALAWGVEALQSQNECGLCREGLGGARYDASCACGVGSDRERWMSGFLGCQLVNNWTLIDRQYAIPGAATPRCRAEGALGESVAGEYLPR